ncbi:MAG: hypothetical protein ACTSQA_00405 [Candidatus Heimdallarchaeaceae archaeon]
MMLTTINEVAAVSQVINGVDNPNLMSVDSTAPIDTVADEVKAVDDNGEASIQTNKEVVVTVETESKEEGEVEKEKKVKSTEGEKTVAEVEEEEGKGKEVEETDRRKVKVEESGGEKTSAKVEKRIGKLTRKWRTAERTAEAEKIKRAELEAELNALKAVIPDTDKPSADDFDDTEEYIEALTDWKIEQKFKAQNAKVINGEKEIVDKKTIEDNENMLDEVIEDGRDKYADYDTVVFDENLTITQGMYDIIIDSEIASDVLYYLGQNPDVALELSELSELKVSRRIGKIESILENAVVGERDSTNILAKSISSTGGIDGIVKPPKTKKVTNAPAPITPVQTDGVIDKDPSKMNMREYRKWRNKNKE